MTGTRNNGFTGIIGYVFRGQTVCHNCVGRAMNPPTYTTGCAKAFRADRVPTEQFLDAMALPGAGFAIKGIDRADETSFDSDYFPKVVLVANTPTDKVCELCDEPLID